MEESNQTKVQTNHDLGINNQLGIDLGPLAGNSFGEKYFFSLHRNTFHELPSSIVYQPLYEKEIQQEDTLYIVAGSDSGLLLKYFNSIELPSGVTIILIDFEEVIEQCCADFNNEENDHRVYITSPSEWYSLAEKHSIEDYLFIGKVSVLLSFAVKDGFMREYRELAQRLEKKITDLKWQAVLSNGSKIFVETQINNLAENCYSAVELGGIFEGKKAVFLAGGPSLDNYIEWVEKNREYFIVIAVSRIAKRLLSTNIVPDFIVSIDPNSFSFDVSKELLEYGEKTVLVHHYHMCPRLLSQWSGINYYMGKLYPWVTPSNGEHTITVGPTVSNASLHLAQLMGIKEIILIGLDLCYSPKGFSHASGSIEHKVGPISGTLTQLVETNSGEIAETETSLFNAINSLKSQAKAAKELGCQYINPSPNAVKVDNVLHIPIDDIILDKDEQTRSKIQTQMQKLLSRASDKDKIEHIYACMDEIAIAKKTLNKIIKKTNKALNYNELFFQDDEPEKHFKYKLKMDEVEEQLRHSLYYIGEVCKSYGINEFLKFIKPAHDENMSNDELKQWGDTYYKAYRQGAIDLKLLLKSTRKRLKYRLQEFTELRNTKKITQYWLEENSPGRALIYKNNQPEAFQRLNSKETQLMQNCIEQFHLDVTEDQKKSHQYQRILKQADLNGCETKLVDMFRRNDETGLQRMIRSLEAHNNEQSKPYLNLAHGLLHELSKNFETAIDYYAKADQHPCLEQALKQISLIALEKMEMEFAENSLILLSEISPSYLPNLASLYQLTKNYKNAADTYALYLEQFPEDIVQLLELAKIYHETENIEGEKFVYEHILSIDKNNPIALAYLNLG